MIIQLKNYSTVKSSQKLTLRCPSCRQIGTFDSLISNAIVESHRNPVDRKYLGQRRCPNSECHAHIFVVWNSKDEVLVSYPPERIDFDSTDIPDDIVGSLEEALTCHANQAYTASAIMIRRTLEEICDDRNAKGKNLKQRISSLGQNVILPPALLSGLDNLRLLGNDAAHIEAKTFAEVGQVEIELAIEVTKEVLKSVYQMDSIVKRLEQLKSKNNSKGT
jgi:hypothetical protein